MRRQILRRSYPLLRPLLRAWWTMHLGLPAQAAREDGGAVTPLVRIKNEDLWIETIVRTLCRVFPRVVVLDNGSQDQTLSILCSLRTEGLPLELYSYADPLHLDNLVRNLVLERAVRSPWYYLVDGDELQYEGSCRVILASCSDPENDRFYKMATHARYPHPDAFLRTTPPFCRGVRYRHGRVFRRGRVQFSEPGWRDTLVGIKNQDIEEHLNRYLFLGDAFLLHAVFAQRSSIRAWSGWQAIDSEQGLWRRSHYLAQEDCYFTLDAFPKEFLECRYSDHNPYRGELTSAPTLAFV